MTDEVPDIDTCFPTSYFTFSGICFWNCLRLTVGFFYLVFRKIQFSICDVISDRGNNICDCYIFIILRTVFFFLNSEEVFLCLLYNSTQQQK